jgi:hypothetical protein
LVYWAEWGGGTVQRTDLDGAAPPEEVYASATGRPIGIAVDPAAGKMYWTEWTTLLVRRADLDGGGVETLATADASPWGVALGPDPAPLPAPVVQLTHNTTIDVEPDVDDGRVVWRGTGAMGTAEIFLWDGSAPEQITADGTHDRTPHVSGPNLAWISDIDSDGEIFFWNGVDDPVQVSDDPLNHSGYSLDGDRVAYSILDGSDLDIVVWEGGSVTQLTHDNALHAGPSISGDHLVWVSRHFGGSDTEIVFWDGIGETRLTDDAGDDDVPILDGSYAAWMSFEEGDWHIVFWDGTTAQRIESPATNERYPDL